MSEKEKQPQNKVRMNISISRELYEFITQTRGNASKIAEQAYSALYSAAKNNSVFVLDMKTLKIAPIYPNGDGPAGIRTQDLQHVRLALK